MDKKARRKKYTAQLMLVIISLVFVFDVKAQEDQIFTVESPALDKAEDEGLDKKNAYFDGGELQMDLIRAKIYSRKGMHKKSLDLYQKLREVYPQHEDVWADYIETLISFSLYEQAQTELQRLIQTYPSNIRAQWLMACIFYRLRQYRLTYDIFETILRQNRQNLGTLSDYAFAKSAVGDWAGALNFWEEILEKDPENILALRQIHEILKEHCPRLETYYRIYSLGDASSIRTSSLVYTRHLTQRTNLDLSFDRIRVERDSDSALGIASLSKTIEIPEMRVRHIFFEKWQAEAGIAPYSGLGGGTSVFLSLNNPMGRRGRIGLAYDRHRPWYDPVEAVMYDSYFHRIAFSFNWYFDDAWTWHNILEQFNYYADNSDKYGKERSFTTILTKHLLIDPNLYLSYSFHRSIFDYETNNTAIPMIKSETIHGLSFFLEHRLCTYLTCTLSGGVKRDTARSLNSWFALPAVNVRLGNRIECCLSYEYSSESGTVAGEKTETINLHARIIF